MSDSIIKYLKWAIEGLMNLIPDFILDKIITILGGIITVEIFLIIISFLITFGPTLISIISLIINVNKNLGKWLCYLSFNCYVKKIKKKIEAEKKKLKESAKKKIKNYILKFLGFIIRIIEFLPVIGWVVIIGRLLYLLTKYTYEKFMKPILDKFETLRKKAFNKKEKIKAIKYYKTLETAIKNQKIIEEESEVKILEEIIKNQNKLEENESNELKDIIDKRFK